MDPAHTPYMQYLPLAAKAAIFTIIFATVLWAMSHSPFFEGGRKVILALCVAVLAMYGLDQAQVRAIAIPYAAMALAILLTLIVLLVVRLARRIKWRRQRDPWSRMDRARRDE